MKKQITLFALILFLSAPVHAQSFKWAVQAGGTDYDTGEDLAVDADNNVYMVGIFNATSDFDPGGSTYNLSSAGAQDIYVMKLDSNKNFIWAVRVGGKQQDFAYSIAVNGNSVYVCGNFKDTVDFNPGAGINNLVSAGGSDIFILKLDTASIFSWVQQVGGTGNDVAEELTLDNAGNILIIGEFQNIVDFDPGAGLQNMTSNGSADVYVLKLNTGGNYIWSGQYGNNPGQFAFGIATDAANAVYVTGEFYGTTDFDPGAAVYNMSATGFNANIYVLKWSAAGNFIWAGNMGNSSGGDFGVNIKCDGAGNPVITGTYFGTVDFDPGVSIYNLTASGTNGDIFVLKLTSASGAFMFAKSIGGPTLDQAYGLALNTAGDIYVSGFFSTTADFDPDTSVTYNLAASGSADAFILELDASGNFVWAYGFGGTDNDFAGSITSHESDVYACGHFAYTPDFDPGIPVYNLSSFSPAADAFILKLRFCTPLQTSVNYSLCPGDSVFTGGAYQFNPGLYYDYFTAIGGCDSIVTTNVQYTFTFNLGNDVSSCAGQSVLLDPNVSGAAYLWSTGATTQTIIVSNTNSYWVSVTYNGCVQQDTILVTFQPLPLVELGTDTVLCTTASLTLDAGPGFTSYLWSDGSTLQTFILNGGLGTGVYTVSITVTDSLGCSNTDDLIVTVDLCTGIEDAFSLSGCRLNIYPNPAGEFTVIKSDENIKQITLTDISGITLMSKNYRAGINSVELSLKPFTDGLYFLKVQNDRIIRTTKLVIQH